MSTLELGMIGNCAISALIGETGTIQWCCLPRFDGDPFFSALLANEEQAAERGFWQVEIANFASSSQRYERNSAVLVTTLTDRDGASLDIVDFCPRFRNFDRMFHPTMIVRQLRPVSGSPKVRVRIRPTVDYGSGRPTITRGSNHVRFVGPDLTMRLTTDATISYLLEETWFLLDQPLSMMLGPDESLTSSLAETARTFRERTDSYWREWSRALSIPYEWQDVVIRSAITLKLSTFEETGAIVAAMTTSVPEAAGSERNWDYRLCWLRDAYFVVHALNRLSATKTLERYLNYISNIAVNVGSEDLQPLYGLSLAHKLDEFTVEGLAGYRGNGPVRVGNAAYTQIQNDVYGAVILAAAQSFFDSRIGRPGNEDLYRELAKLGQMAVQKFDKPDAGIWELRTIASVHTFSALMCWAAADRLGRIADRIGHSAEAAAWRQHASEMRRRIMEEAWNEELGSYVSTFGGDQMDASLLLMHELGFHDGKDPRFVGTVAMIEKQLRKGDHLFRYIAPDDFGVPETAFNVCTFWFIEALAVTGREAEAREMFGGILACRNKLGLLSEDVDPETGELWGNFPQTYSMVGMIKCAMRLSRKWEDAF
ncbi:MAG: glycoside hydrolase family 15 protein [Nisaea sp.]|uniref:glycoside hydrolase family 15 protein n=1 Tax=Nisaea sp. TaxID=2024842 RepID=UPI001B1E334D|nr:glycoside hydrolase family 15 protein [Nisaea sp.]MBO6559652.1 glycoside hydrolase family 15 protein [Nisaea sp.]